MQLTEYILLRSDLVYFLVEWAPTQMDESRQSEARTRNERFYPIFFPGGIRGH